MKKINQLTPEIRFKRAQSHFKAILSLMGEDTNREGLKRTPERYIAFLQAFLNPPPFKFTMFSAEGMDEMIIENRIPFFSMCEHHTLLFSGLAHVAYIPDGKIVGLSKIPRVVNLFSSRLQNQERITRQISDYLMIALKPKGVAVLLEARHSCMECRGVKSHGTVTTTTSLTGAFKSPEVRAEFMASVSRNNLR